MNKKQLSSLICVVTVISLTVTEAAETPKDVKKATASVTKAPGSVDSRFFDLGGMFNQLFQGYPRNEGPGNSAYPGNGLFQPGFSNNYPQNTGGGDNWQNNAGPQNQYPYQQNPISRYPNQDQQMNGPFQNQGQQMKGPFQNQGQQMNGPFQNQEQQMNKPFQNQEINGPSQNQGQQMNGPFQNQEQQMNGPYQNQEINGPSLNQGQQMNGPFQNQELNGPSQNQGGFARQPNLNEQPMQRPGGFQYPSDDEVYPVGNQNNYYPDQGQGGGGTLDDIMPTNPTQGSPLNTPGSNRPPNRPNDDQTGGSSSIWRPVVPPSTTVSPDTIYFSDSTESPFKKQCVQDCQSTSEYNPICGSNNVTYFNPGRFVCARNCGVNVYIFRQGRCTNY